jgi:methylphosphotriester-DNA--protein-cysteine methyltransferase
MDIQNPSQALIEHLKEASHLAESIMKSAQQSTQVPVPLRELASEIQRRMDEYNLSITLLSTTEHPIKSVAYLCGFQQEERMRRLFIKHLGITPSQYRCHFGLAAQQ